MRNGNGRKPDKGELSAKQLAEVARQGTRRAVAETFALGLPITVLEGDAIVKIYPNGKKRVLKKLKLKPVPVTQRVIHIK